MSEIDKLERELRRFAGRDLQPIAKEAVIQGKTAPDMQIWINALKECVRYRFLTPNEAMWFKERVLESHYRPEVKRHLYQKLLSRDITTLLGALTNVKGVSKSGKGILKIIYNCDKISHGASIDKINQICNDCRKRIKDVERIAQNKTPQCPILNLSALIDLNTIEITKSFNPFKYVERYPVDYLDVWEKEMIKQIKEFKKAYMVRPYTNYMYYRDLFSFRENTELGRRISNLRNKVMKISKKIIKLNDKLPNEKYEKKRRKWRILKIKK